MPTTHATVVVATRNRSTLLPRLVGALEAQAGAPSFDLVVVNDASDDDTEAVLRDLEASSSVPLTVLQQRPRGGQSAARNKGWRVARGDVVLFTDDDCVPGPLWIRRMVDALGDHDIVQGRTTPAAAQAHHEGPFSRTLDITEANGWYATCNIGYRRDQLEAVDGFDESFRQYAGEDTDLALRCIDRGGRFTFEEGAVVEHDIRPSSFVAALRGTWRWLTLPKTVARHRSLRAAHHSRWFWRETHVPTVWALGGLTVAAATTAGGHRGTALAVAAAGGLPYANYRLRRVPVSLDKVQRVALLPAVFVVDAAEVGVLVLGSVWARKLLL